MGFQITISEKRGKYDKFQAPRLQAIRVALNVSSVTYFTHFLTIYHLINHSRGLDLDLGLYCSHFKWRYRPNGSSHYHYNLELIFI